MPKMAIWRMGRRSLSLGLTYLFLKTCEGIRDCETIRMSEHSPDDVRCAGYSPSPRPFVSLTIRCPRWSSPLKDRTDRISRFKEYDTCPEICLCLVHKSRSFLCNAVADSALKRSRGWSKRPFSLG